MAQKRIMIELKSTPALHEAAAMAADISTPLPEFSMDYQPPALEGVQFDKAFPLTPIPAKRTSEFSARFSTSAGAVESPTYIVRGVLDDDYSERVLAARL
jgi:hypothetical protein